MSTDDRIAIVQVFLAGTSIGDISTPLNVSRRTIESVIREGFTQTLALKVPPKPVTLTDSQ